MQILFKDMVRNSYDGISGRENIEWSNFWWENANKNTTRRFLLIGDSTVRMVRSTFAEVTKSPVDMLGTSSDFDDVLFISQVDAFFSTTQYKYNAIFLQMGHHARTSKDGGMYTSKDLLRFRRGADLFLDYLSQHCENIIVESIFDSIIPPSSFKIKLIKRGLMKGLINKFWGKEIKDDMINSVTNRKNEVLYELTKSRNLKWLDINKLINTKNFKHIDHIHFENRAKKYIAEEMMNALN